MSASRVRMGKSVLRRDAGREFDVDFGRRVGADAVAYHSEPRFTKESFVTHKG